MSAATAIRAGAGEGFIMSTQEHFAVQLPPGFTITKRAPVEDFEIFTVAKQDVPYVLIYVGNQPRFPSAEPSATQHVTTLQGPGIEMCSTWENDQLVGREVLLKLTDSGWPARLHAWLAPNLGPKEIQTADMILSSLVVGKRPGEAARGKPGKRQAQHARKTPGIRK
jgi:hypothetical protein